MIPIPQGFFTSGYDLYSDFGMLFGVSMFRDQDWTIVNTNELRLRDIVTGNFAYTSTGMRREDNGATKCFTTAAQGYQQILFSFANPAWASLMQGCPSGISVVIAGYSKVTQNNSIADGADHLNRSMLTYRYRPNSSDAEQIWWDMNRGVNPFNGNPAFGGWHQQNFRHGHPTALHSVVGFYTDDVPGCVTTPAKSATITTPAYLPGDFVMWTLSKTSTGPRLIYNTTVLPVGTNMTGGNVNGPTADVRPANWYNLQSGCQLNVNGAMRTVFAGIYNEPLSDNPGKLAQIYHTLRAQ